MVVSAQRAAAALDARKGQIYDNLERWLWAMCVAPRFGRRMPVNDATAQARPKTRVSQPLILDCM